MSVCQNLNNVTSDSTTPTKLGVLHEVSICIFLSQGNIATGRWRVRRAPRLIHINIGYKHGPIDYHSYLQLHGLLCLYLISRIFFLSGCAQLRYTPYSNSVAHLYAYPTGIQLVLQFMFVMDDKQSACKHAKQQSGISIYRLKAGNNETDYCLP